MQRPVRPIRPRGVSPPSAAAGASWPHPPPRPGRRQFNSTNLRLLLAARTNVLVRSISLRHSIHLLGPREGSYEAWRPSPPAPRSRPCARRRRSSRRRRRRHSSATLAASAAPRRPRRGAASRRRPRASGSPASPPPPTSTEGQCSFLFLTPAMASRQQRRQLTEMLTCTVPRLQPAG